MKRKHICKNCFHSCEDYSCCGDRFCIKQDLTVDNNFSCEYWEDEVAGIENALALLKKARE